jgi:hypothetical protein
MPIYRKFKNICFLSNYIGITYSLGKKKKTWDNKKEKLPRIKSLVVVFPYFTNLRR